MVLPFALAAGLGIALGIIGAPLLWMLAVAAACAALYMWNTRKTEPPAGPGGALIAYAGLVLLTGLIGGASYFLGDFFGWARLEP